MIHTSDVCEKNSALRRRRAVIVKETITRSGETPAENYVDKDYVGEADYDDYDGYDYDDYDKSIDKNDEKEKGSDCQGDNNQNWGDTCFYNDHAADDGVGDDDCFEDGDNNDEKEQ